jgi:membrane complex biogenesis BtpA family protein
MADPFTLVGVIHLLPLPGAPRSDGSLTSVVDRALADADALVQGGIHHCIIENIGDAPFRANAVDPHVPAILAVLGERIRQTHGSALSVGINVLRNDARSAMGAAVACGAAFIRVNVFISATWTDQGLIQGCADQLMRYRASLCGPGGPRVMADVCVKHGVPAGETDIAVLAREAAERGGADGLIVTGTHTGGATALADVHRVRDAVPDRPVWVGSGVNLAAAAAVREAAHGAIVGTWLHRDGDIRAPIEEDRVRRMVDGTRS